MKCFSVSRHREYPVRVCGSEGHNFAVKPEGVQLGVGMCDGLHACLCHTAVMISSSRTCCWAQGTLRCVTVEELDASWKLSSTVCLRVSISVSSEEHHYLEFIVETSLNCFPLDTFNFFIVLLGEIVTPLRLFAHNGLCFVRCEGRSWLSFRNMLNSCSAYVCNDFDPLGFVSCTVHCTNKWEGGNGCNWKWLQVDWLSFWIHFISTLVYQKITSNRDQSYMSLNLLYANSLRKVLQFGNWCLSSTSLMIN